MPETASTARSNPRRASKGAPPDPPVVFDCDGLLVDTEGAWTVAERALFAYYGRPFGLEEKRALLGAAGAAQAPILERLLGRPGRGAELGEELLALVTAEVERDGARARPGAAELVRELRDAGRPVAVCSSSPRPFVELALASAGLDGLFDASVCGGEAGAVKPAPDPYLRACALLGAAPAAAVALEDSPTGLASARAAGLWTVGVPSVAGVSLEADLVVPSLAHPVLREALAL